MRTRVLYITTALVLGGAVIIWLNKEFFLGLPGFFAWFVAGVTVVVLAVSIIIKSVPPDRTLRADRNPENNYTERREFPRIQHRLPRRPCLQIDQQEFEVLDISERGIRFLNNTPIQLSDWIRGTLVFSDKSTLNINGIVIRTQADTVSLQLITTIPAEMIARETEHHLSSPGEPSDRPGCF